MKTIFNEILHHQNHGQDCMWLSIVGDRGSAPRTSGAHMLVDARGRVCGTVGGGAVEFRCEQMALEQLHKKHSLLHQFRLNTADTDALNMICGGNVTVLFRYVPADDPDWQALTSLVMTGLDSRRRCWLVDDLSDIDLPPVLAEAEGALTGSLPDALLPQLRGELPLNLSLEQRQFYAEPLPRGERVIIFGGGHISRELTPLLAHLDFRVTVFDSRPEYTDPALLPGAEATVLGDYRNIGDKLTILPDDYIVIMTNGHANDYDAQRFVMKYDHAYLGVIGSRAKTALLNKKLLAEGFTKEQLDRVYTPIGTAIKAQTPAEIAVSIAGELILVRAERRQTLSSSCPV